MDTEKTRIKLKKLNDSELATLLSLVLNERDERFECLSNKTHTPREQATSLARALSQAWIHG